MIVDSRTSILPLSCSPRYFDVKLYVTAQNKTNKPADDCRKNSKGDDFEYEVERIIQSRDVKISRNSIAEMGNRRVP